MPQVLFVDYSSAFHTRVPSRLKPFPRLSTPASWWRRPPLPPLVAQRLSGPTQGAQDPFTPTPSKRILCRRIVTLMGNCTNKDFLHSAQHSQFLRKWHRTAQTFCEGSISPAPPIPLDNLVPNTSPSKALLFIHLYRDEEKENRIPWCIKKILFKTHS